MAKAVKQKFENVVSRDGDGHIIVNLPDLSADESVIVETNASVEVKAPAVEQDNTPDVIQSSLDSDAYEIGQMVEGKGLYQGIWSPNYSNGYSCGKTFDLYAAPYDLKEYLDGGDSLRITFYEASHYLASLKNWHGHDGGDLRSDRDVIMAVKNNPEQLENWFVPTKEILHGENIYGEKVQDDHLFGNRKKMPSGGGYYMDTEYWSCTERDRGRMKAYYVRFYGGGNASSCYMGHGDKAVRLVRAELRL